MSIQERLEVVNQSGLLTNISIEAARPNRGPQNIPDRDLFRDESHAALIVATIDSEQLAHNWPARVLWMRVVLLIS